MGRFPKFRLVDLATEPLSYGSGASAVPFDGKRRYIRITDLLPDGTLKPEASSPNVFDDKYLLQNGDLLFARSGATVGKTYLHGEYEVPCIYAGYLIRFKPNLKKTVPSYVFYYTKSASYKNFIERNQKVVAQPNINAKQYGSLEIPLPPLDEQARIAAELDAVAATLKKRQTQLAELDALVEARFAELFGAVGTHPKRFPERVLSDVCQVNPKKNAALFPNDDFLVSFVPMPAVSERGEIDASTVRPYRDVKKGFTFFEENDVLFAKITPCMENGKGAVARGLKNGVGFGSTEFHVLRPKTGVSNPFWLYHITALRQFRRDAEKKMTGSAGQRRVPAAFLENYRVALPPLKLQERFAAEVAQIKAVKATVRAGIAETQTLFDALLQRYFG